MLRVRALGPAGPFNQSDHDLWVQPVPAQQPMTVDQYVALLFADDDIEIQGEAGAADLLRDAGVAAISTLGAWGGVKGHSKVSWTVYVMTFTDPPNPLIGDLVAQRELWRAALGPELAALADDRDAVASVLIRRAPAKRHRMGRNRLGIPLYVHCPDMTQAHVVTTVGNVLATLHLQTPTGSETDRAAARLARTVLDDLTDAA